MPTRPPVVACLSALNEERTIQDVLEQISLCPLVDAALVVVNGSSDRTAALAKAKAGAGRLRVLVREIPEPLGHDVGRAVAAQWALAEEAAVLVFLDADFAVRANDIAPFVVAVEGGVDVALNALTPLVGGWGALLPTASARVALNAFLGRPDLGVDGLVAVPHALSRRAVLTIGPATLAIPPLAHARAIMSGLHVKAVHTVDVITPNRRSAERPRPTNRAEMVGLILGDHLEAVAEVIARRGPRGGFPDLDRKRDHIGAPAPGKNSLEPGPGGR